MVLAVLKLTSLKKNIQGLVLLPALDYSLEDTNTPRQHFFLFSRSLSSLPSPPLPCFARLNLTL